MRIRKTRALRPLGVALAAIMLPALAGSVPGGQTLSAASGQPAGVEASSGDMFNIDLQVPEGSRIDYVRFYYYDSEPSRNSSVWLTSYDGMGNFVDLTYVASEGSDGYGSRLSSYIGYIVDTHRDAYVLNWQPGGVGPEFKLCALRVAYRLDGGSSSLYYQHIAGTALRPREGSTQGRYGGGGCLYQAPYAIHIPLIVRGS